jgi:sialic acid synthase SpsE
MGLVAKRDIAVGEPITLKNVTFAFPAVGIEVEYWREVVGGIIANPILAGQIINWKDLRDIPR